MAHFYMGLFIVFLDPIQFQSGLLTRLASGDLFSGECDVFSFGMLHVTDIWSRYGNSPSCSSKLNKKHAGGCSRSLRWIVFRVAILLVKLKNSEFAKISSMTTHNWVQY